MHRALFLVLGAGLLLGCQNLPQAQIPTLPTLVGLPKHNRSAADRPVLTAPRLPKFSGIKLPTIPRRGVVGPQPTQGLTEEQAPAPVPRAPAPVVAAVEPGAITPIPETAPELVEKATESASPAEESDVESPVLPVAPPTPTTPPDLVAYVGLTKWQAIAKAKGEGRNWRIAREDQNEFPTTADLITTRVNFHIDSGQITSATSG